MSTPQRHHLRRHLYLLKRKWPLTVDIYHETGEVVDLASGKRSVTPLKYRVPRAIALPRKFAQSSVLAIALKEIWSRGSKVETADRTILVDRADLPKGLEIGLENWYVIAEETRYEILSREEYESLAYVLTLKSLTGAPRYAEVEIKMTQRIATEGEITHDP